MDTSVLLAVRTNVMTNTVSVPLPACASASIEGSSTEEDVSTVSLYVFGCTHYRPKSSGVKSFLCHIRNTKVTFNICDEKQCIRVESSLQTGLYIYRKNRVSFFTGNTINNHYVNIV